MVNNNLLVYKSKMTYDEIAPVLRSLKDTPYAIIKGEALSLAAYGRVGQRTSSDVDILISKDNILFLEKLLIENGFSSQYYDDKRNQRINRVLMLSASNQVSPFHKKKGAFDLSIDINFDIFWGEFTNRRVSIDEFISDTTMASIYGNTVKVLTPVKAMVQVILHHYKEFNSIYHLATHKAIKSNMLKDVYYLWKNNKSEISIDRLYSLCQEMGIIPYAYYVLYYTNYLFHDQDLEIYLKNFENEEGKQLLDQYGLAEDEKKIWKVDFDTRLNAENTYDLIKDDLTPKDIKKVSDSKKIFK